MASYSGRDSFKDKPPPVSELRHERSVVSATGHFLSFSSELAMLASLVGLGSGEYGMPNTAEKLILFFAPSVRILINPLLQVLFSHRLRGDLKDLLLLSPSPPNWPCSRP